jgi:hypothetical protein
MNNVFPSLLLMAMALVSVAQNGQHDSQKDQTKQLMCDAAAKQLRESATNNVVLRMTVDGRGRVESFTTESPKGLRLEKMKEVAAAIKAIRFEPAKKTAPLSQCRSE